MRRTTGRVRTAAGRRAGTARRAALFAMTALLAPAALSAGARADPPAPVMKGSLKGHVENERRQALEGAVLTVEVPGRPPIRAVTDANGDFQMAPVPIGDVTVKFRAKGCFPQDQHVVVAGRGVTTVAATLKLGVRYAGRVHDAAGNPVEGVRVRTVVLTKGEDVTWDDLANPPPAAADTSADGSFLVDGLEPGKRYALRFKHPHYRSVEVSRDLPSKGGTSKEGIDVAMADAAWVTGTVLDDAGKPVANAQVFGDPDFPSHGKAWVVEDMSAIDGRRAEENRSDARGRFLVGGIVNPSADLLVEAEGYFPFRLALTGLVAGKETSGVEAKLEKATASVEGSVVDAKGKGVPDAWVVAEGDEGTKSAKTDKGGRFKIASIPSHGPMKVRVDAADWIGTSQESVAPGSKGLKLAVARAPRIRIKVTDVTGTPIPLVAIRVRPVVGEADAEGRRHRTHADQAGDQPEAGFDVACPFVGAVEAVLNAEGYEITHAGPWTVKAGETFDAGTVAMKRKAAEK